MKNIFTITFLIISLACTSFLNADEKADESPYKWDFISETAAKVNGEKIMKGELISFIQSSTDPRILFKLSEKELKNYTKEMLHRLINQIIQAKIAEEEGYKPGFDLIKKELETMLSKISKKRKKEFIKDLSANKMNIDDLCRKKAENKFESLQFAIDAWFKNKIKPETKVSEEEIKDFYKKAGDMVAVSQILIKYDSNSKESRSAAKKQADDILKSIKSGKDFYALAKEKSQCNSNYKGRPGAMQPFARGQMVQEFEDAAFSLKVGEISAVIETPFGFHIIKVDNKSKRKLPPFNEKIKDQIKKQLILIKAQDKVIEKIKKANKQYKIEITPFK